MTPEEIREQFKKARFDAQTYLLAEIAAQLAEIKLELEASTYQWEALNEKFRDFFTLQGAEK